MFKAMLAGKHKLNDLAYARKFLCLEITTGSDYPFLNQWRFIQTVLNRFGMADCNSLSTPLEVKCFVSTTPECDKGNQAQYQSILGSLMNLAIGSTPDISYAVGMLSKFSINTRAVHLAAVKRLVRYIKGTMHLGYYYHSGCTPDIEGFCDSDFAGDSQDSKSTSG